MASPKQEAHWAATRSLMIITMLLWFFFGTVVFAFGEQINHIKFLGYPLAYYMTAQGSFLRLLSWFFGLTIDKKKLIMSLVFPTSTGRMI